MMKLTSVFHIIVILILHSVNGSSSEDENLEGLNKRAESQRAEIERLRKELDDLMRQKAEGDKRYQFFKRERSIIASANEKVTSEVEKLKHGVKSGEMTNLEVKKMKRSIKQYCDNVMFKKAQCKELVDRYKNGMSVSSQIPVSGTLIDESKNFDYYQNIKISPDEPSKSSEAESSKRNYKDWLPDNSNKTVSTSSKSKKSSKKKKGKKKRNDSG